MTKDTYHHQLVELFRVHHLISGMVGRTYGSELSATESFIIIELDVDASRSVVDIARVLNIDKGAVSRSISFLIEQKYLTSATSDKDRRRKVVEIAPRGREFLALHDKFNAQYLAKQSANISASEMLELQLFFKTLADGLGAPNTPIRAHENPIFAEIRRISRAFGIFGNTLAGSAYSVEQFQMLTEIAAAKGNSRVKDLAFKFRIPDNTVSQMISRLEQAELIEKRTYDSDKRNRFVCMKPEGEIVLRQIEDRCADLFRTALRSLSEEETKHFCNLFRKYLGDYQQGLDEQMKSAQLGAEFVHLQKEAQQRQARLFLIQQYARTEFTFAPEILLGENSFSYALQKDAKTLALCEFQLRRGALLLANFATIAKLDGAEEALVFLKQSLEEVRKSLPKAEVIAFRHCAAFELLKKIGHMTEIEPDLFQLA